MADTMAVTPASGPDALSRIPGNVRTEQEAAAEAQDEATRDGLEDMSVVARLNLTGLQGPDYNDETLAGLGSDVPAPRVMAPPPKVRPPQWLAPPPPPPPVDNYGPVNEVDSEADLEDEIAGNYDIRLSKLQEFIAMEQGMQKNCRSLPVTLALWLTFVMLIFHHGQALASYKAANYIEQTVQAAQTMAPIALDADATTPRRSLRLGDIHYIEDILPWTEDGLIKTLTSDGTTGHGQLAKGAQAVINFVRITQTRGVNTSLCSHLTPVLQELHGGGCHPALGAVTAYGGMNVTSKDDAFRPQGENTLVAWIEMGRLNTTISERFHMLNEGGWLDMNTQEVLIEAILLAPEAYVWSLLTVSFKLHREGLMEQTVKVQPIRGDIYSNWLNALFDLAWVVVLAALLVSAITSALHANLTGTLMRHVFDVFVWLDWSCLVAGFLLGLFFWVLVWELETFVVEVIASGNSIPAYPVFEAPQSMEIEMIIKNREFQDRLSEQLNNFRYLCETTEMHRLFSFWYSMALAGRFLRGFAGQPRIAVLIQVFSFSADFLYHYMVVGIVVFASFTLGGYVLFGEQLLGYSTFGYSINSVLGVLFGRYEYEDLHGVAPLTAAFWYWTLFVIVFLLLLSILMAAVIHRYIDVQRRLGEPGASIAQQAAEMYRVFRFRKTYEGVQKSIPYEALLAATSQDMDEREISRTGRLKVDRRLRTRNDLGKEAVDMKVDVDFLKSAGCDETTAEHLLDRITRWRNSISMANSPEHRLVVQLAQHMTHCMKHSGEVRERTLTRVNFAASSVDRMDIKHAKCCAMARRLKKVQDLPSGWTVHHDAEGRRYLRQNETGLTSWTLPKTVNS